jgi:hypothetical protein
MPRGCAVRRLAPRSADQRFTVCARRRADLPDHCIGMLVAYPPKRGGDLRLGLRTKLDERHDRWRASSFPQAA